MVTSINNTDLHKNRQYKISICLQGLTHSNITGTDLTLSINFYQSIMQIKKITTSICLTVTTLQLVFWAEDDAVENKVVHNFITAMFCKLERQLL